MDKLVVNAKTRTKTGKSASRLLRKAGRLPAVMYNTRGETEVLDVDAVEFTKVWKLTTPTTLIALAIDGKAPKLAFIKATEYNIITDKNLHVDFHVIDEDKPLIVSMKVLFSGNPVGVRDGGVFEKSSMKVDIKCLPKDLPVRITADVSTLALNQSLLVKDLPFGKGITVLTDGGETVASVRPMRQE